MSDLPRLLFCCFDVVPGPTAISRRLTEYVKDLSERFQVVVLSVKTPDHPHIEKYHGARLLRVPVSGTDLAARVQTFDRAVRRQLESEEYLIVHFFDPFGGYALAEKHSELGYKLVYDACAFPSMDFPTDEVESNRKLLAKVRRQELFCLMNADAVIVGNPLTRDWVSTVGVERERVHLLPAPVDLGPYREETLAAPDAPKMRIVHLGSLAPSHGLGVLLEALQLARASAPITLTLIGPPNLSTRARLEEQAAKLGLSAAVEFQPPVAHDDVHKVLATADLGALTLDDSERNRIVGSPLSRLPEYLAAGLPLVAADVTSARQLVPDDTAAWYRPGDVRSLADALVSLALDPARRVRMGAAARAAAARWSSHFIRTDLLAVYGGIVGSPVATAGEEFLAANEPTQLGRSMVAAESGEVTQLGVRPFDAARDPGRNPTPVAAAIAEERANKAPTDPAVDQPDTATDAQGPGERPAIMGTPVREDLPPVIEGIELPEEVPAEALAPLAPPIPTPGDMPQVRPTAPPMPVIPIPGTAADQISREFTPVLEVEPARTLPPVPSAPHPPPVRASLPHAARPTAPELPTPSLPELAPLDRPLSTEPAATAPGPEVESVAELPEPALPLIPLLTPPPPLPPPTVSAPVPAPRPPPVEKSPLASAPLPKLDEVRPGPIFTPAPFPIPPLPLPPISAPPAVLAAIQLPAPPPPVALLPPPPAPPSAAPAEDEVLEIADDEVEELHDVVESDEVELAAEEVVQSVDVDASPPPSAIDPWLAQLVHGYCPPGSGLFDRHVPPTTMPGRDT